MKNVLRTVHDNRELKICTGVDVTERARHAHIAVAIIVWKIQKRNRRTYPPAE